MNCHKCGFDFQATLAGGCPKCGALAHEAPVEERAGFWVRCAARILDYGVLAAVVIGLMSLLKGPPGALFAAAIWCLYHPVLTARGGQTVGKMVVGIRVVRMDGSAVGLGRAFLRWLGFFLSALPSNLGYLWVGLSAEKRGFHDMLAGTKVVCLQPRGQTAVLVVVIVNAAIIFVGLMFALLAALR